MSRFDTYKDRLLEIAKLRAVKPTIDLEVESVEIRMEIVNAYIEMANTEAGKLVFQYWLDSIERFELSLEPLLMDPAANQHKIVYYRGCIDMLRKTIKVIEHYLNEKEKLDHKLHQLLTRKESHATAE